MRPLFPILGQTLVWSAVIGMSGCALVYDFDRPLPPGIGTDVPADPQGSDGGFLDGLIPVLPADSGPAPDMGVMVEPNRLCPPLGQRRGNTIELGPDQVESLPGLVSGAAPNTTIKLLPGQYVLDQGLQLAADGLILRSTTGNRGSVTISGRGLGADDSVITITGSDVTVADLTIIDAQVHGIWVRGPDMGAPGRTGPLIYNMHIRDSRSSAIMLDSPDASDMDDGTIGCSHIELTPAGRTDVVDGCLMGGIVLYRAHDWRIHHNLIEGIFCADELALHGIHVASQSARTVIEGNRVLDCARGIGVGYYGEGEPMRPYEGSSCPEAAYVDDNDSLVRNNFVAANDPRLLTSTAGFQHGIGLWNACNTSVYHNTVYSPRAPTDAPIDTRYATTTARLKNNLLSHGIRVRDDAQVVVEGNLENVPAAIFVDPAVGDLHLTPGSEAKDRGVDLGVETPPLDIDGDARSDGLPDPGADEL